MTMKKFSIRHRLQSFKFALNGVKILISEEHNSRIHFVSALCVIIAGIIFKIATLEWIIILFAIGLVITLEIINSSIENMADFISQEKHASIKKVKDLSAAGVLVSSLTALAIGLIIFLPKVLSILF
jgi:diacylglycerol kinase